jgi:Common central domain of tyrosinase.
MATQEETWLSDYFTFRGGEHIVHNEHANWHGSNSFGADPLYGEEFLRFHRYFFGEYDAWRQANGHPPIPLWDPATVIPADVPHPGRATDNPSSVNPACKRPSWATAAGGPAGPPQYPNHHKLADFADRNELGRAIEGSGWHGTVHTTIGGDMGSVHNAPNDPIFWRWHKYVDSVWRDWTSLQPEDKVAFDPAKVKAEKVAGRWKLTEGSHWLFDFGTDQAGAKQAAKVVAHYELNQSCFVGRPSAPGKTIMGYLLAAGQPPSGSFTGETVTAFTLPTLTVLNFNGNWQVMDMDPATPVTSILNFGARKSDAWRAFEIINKFGFTHLCRAGTMMYFRR